MSTVAYLNLEETLKLETQGAQQRLAIAQRELADFHSQHDGVAHPAELEDSLDHQKFALELEVDAAARAYSHAFAAYLEQTKVPTPR